MTLDEATRILVRSGMVQDGQLGFDDTSGSGYRLSWTRGDLVVYVRCPVTADELKAIVVWMRVHKDTP